MSAVKHFKYIVVELLQVEEVGHDIPRLRRTQRKVGLRIRINV